jgi:hypothetical protein
MWLYNTGTTQFTTNPRIDLEKSSLFLLEGVFALWFDSPTSIRCYVYAKKKVDEITSGSVLLPLNQWVNL